MTVTVEDCCRIGLRTGHLDITFAPEFALTLVCIDTDTLLLIRSEHKCNGRISRTCSERAHHH